MKKNLTLWLAVLLAGFVASSAQAQVTQSGNLTAHIDAIIASMPTTNGGGDYQQPNAESRTLWRDIIDHILAGELAEAHAEALTKNYQVVVYTDTGSEDSHLHILLERTPEATSRYWGTFLFNPSPLRSNLVIQSPHPRYDLNTGYQSLRIYLYTGARAYFVAGTHRCNGISYSPCSGTTTACSESAESFRYSDQCHVVDSTFQITTQAMLDEDPDLLIVQPHGYGQGTGDPDLIISNGTRIMPTGTDYAVAIRDAIQDIDPTLTAKVAHINLDWTENLGTYNAQGRLLNGSANPCSSNPSSATGTFVHIEQARIGLRDTQQNWMKLAQAVAVAVPVDAVAVPPATGTPGIRILMVSPNPSGSRTSVVFEIDRPGRTQVDVFDVAGRRVASLDDTIRPEGVHQVSWSAEGMPSGIYFVQLRLRAVTGGRSQVRPAPVNFEGYQVGYPPVVWALSKSTWRSPRAMATFGLSEGDPESLTGFDVLGIGQGDIDRDTPTGSGGKGIQAQGHLLYACTDARNGTDEAVSRIGHPSQPDFGSRFQLQNPVFGEIGHHSGRPRFQDRKDRLAGDHHFTGLMEDFSHPAARGGPENTPADGEIHHLDANLLNLQAGFERFEEQLVVGSVRQAFGQNFLIPLFSFPMRREHGGHGGLLPGDILTQRFECHTINVQSGNRGQFLFLEFACPAQGDLKSL